MKSRQRKKKKWVPPPVKQAKRKIKLADIIVTVVAILMIAFILVCMTLMMKNHIKLKHTHPKEQSR